MSATPSRPNRGDHQTMLTYDGSHIFGSAVQFQHMPQPSAQQVNAFFGVSGTQTLYGGSRGRQFLIRGVLIAESIVKLNEAEAAFQRYADGVARTLVDPRGRAWPNVQFRGEFYPDPRGPFSTPGGWALPYRAVFHGLT
ncbi:MAG: hypothetical protein U0790_23800 [Isosphaeraceae bacterium]